MSFSWKNNWKRSRLSYKCARNWTPNFLWVANMSNLWCVFRGLCCTGPQFVRMCLAYVTFCVHLVTSTDVHSSFTRVRSFFVVVNSWYFYWNPQSTEPGGHFICTVYLEEKKDTTEQHVKVALTKGQQSEDWCRHRSNLNVGCLSTDPCIYDSSRIDLWNIGQAQHLRERQGVLELLGGDWQGRNGWDWYDSNTVFRFVCEPLWWLSGWPPQPVGWFCSNTQITG